MDRFLPPQPVPVIAPGKRVASLYERPAPAVRYTVSLAVDLAEIREAQRLRYQVFSEEQGARLPTILSGHDIDPLDDMCEHVLVRELDSGVVVGTYRILAPARVADAGGYFSERHFDLSRLDSMRPHMAELGRSCVHPGHRSGAVITPCGRGWQVT